MLHGAEVSRPDGTLSHQPARQADYESIDDLHAKHGYPHSDAAVHAAHATKLPDCHSNVLKFTDMQPDSASQVVI